MNAPKDSKHLTPAHIEDDMFIYTGRQTEKPVDILNAVFKRAVEMGAADIHFQQTDSNCRVRFRTGGALSDIEKIDLSIMRFVDEKIRTRSLIPVSERREPQDGRMSLVVSGIKIDVRVAITPGVSEGQLIVCRILNQANSNIRLDDIEMTVAARESFRRVISEPTGLFIITGPTGSGKTTTLYAVLNELNDVSCNIITLEHPVEYRIADFHQIDIDEQTMTFAKGLRAVLRQDPDVIMVGEIRDFETATIAIQAATTGHLVLSTMHANTAAAAITRLLGLGIDAADIGSSLRGVVAQRLVRTIDQNADVEYQEPNETEEKWLRAHNIRRANAKYPKLANQIDGHKGVAPVMEIILADQRVKTAFDKGESAIYEAASRQPQFETLGQAAERLAFTGKTTINEARRTSSVQEAPNIHNRRIGEILVETGKVDAQQMEEILTIQARDHATGQYRRVGEMLIERSLCSSEDILAAVGHTAEAQDILESICTTDDSKQALSKIIKRWTPGRESLFTIAITADLVTQDEINDRLRS